MSELEDRYEALQGVDEEIRKLETDRNLAVNAISGSLSSILMMLDLRVMDDPPGTVKTAGQIRMEVFKAVQLYTLLRHDTDLVGENRSSHFIVTPEKMGLVLPEELYVRKREAFSSDEERDVLAERRHSRIVTKRDILFNPSKDYAHLLEDRYRYLEYSAGSENEVDVEDDYFEDTIDPDKVVIAILSETRDFKETNWDALVKELRAIALNSNRHVIDELLTVSSK